MGTLFAYLSETAMPPTKMARQSVDQTCTGPFAYRRLLLLMVGTLLVLPLSASALQCLGQKGQPVDWSVRHSSITAVSIQNTECFLSQWDYHRNLPNCHRVQRYKKHNNIILKYVCTHIVKQSFLFREFRLWGTHTHTYTHAHAHTRTRTRTRTRTHTHTHTLTLRASLSGTFLQGRKPVLGV